MTHPRIGFASSGLGLTPIGWLSRWLAAELKRLGVELRWFALSPAQANGVSNVFRQTGDHYECYGVSHDTIAEKINAECDILIDLDSITWSGMPSLLRRVRVPVATWLGWDHPGLPTAQHFICDPFVVPSDADYAANLIRLPETYLAVSGFEMGVPTYRREDIGIPANAVVLGQIQKPLKANVNPGYYRAVIEIMAATDAHLVVRAWNDTIPLFWHGLAHGYGVDPGRIHPMPLTIGEEDHRANLSLIDLVLDTFPYNGCTTTLESLWAGTPVLSVKGNSFCGRQGYAFLHHAELPEFCVSEGDYVTEAVDAIKTNRLDHAREVLRLGRRSSVLWDVPRFARHWLAGVSEMVG